MPKSKQRKGHKKRVQNYLNQKKSAENQARKILMEQYQQQQEELSKQINAQKAGADVENTDIDIDLDIDELGVDVGVDDVELTETDDTPLTDS